jgi:hypothetical protein
MNVRHKKSGQITKVLSMVVGDENAAYSALPSEFEPISDMTGNLVEFQQLRIKELKAKLELAQNDLSARTLELELVESERDSMKTRIKRLEDAGDNMEPWCYNDSICKTWRDAKDGK